VTALLGLAFDNKALGKHNEDEQDKTNPMVGRWNLFEEFSQALQ
jgi:hypothetical protein